MRSQRKRSIIYERYLTSKLMNLPEFNNLVISVQQAQAITNIRPHKFCGVKKM